MSALNQFKLLARYNALMNQRILAAADKLSPEQLMDDRGAYFKSVLGTLNHILVGDIIWLQRFASHPASRQPLAQIIRRDSPNSLNTILCDTLDSLRVERDTLDAMIINWIASLMDDDIGAYLSYQNMAGAKKNKPLASLIFHLFLHQTHHRGQVTTLISQYGGDYGGTDILEIIADHTA